MQNTQITLDHINRIHYVKSREIFAKQIVSLLEQGRQIISLDESSFNTNQNLMQGWVNKQRSPIKATLRRFRSITIISAIEFTGEHHYCFVLGNNNRITFLRYLELFVQRMDAIDLQWRMKKTIILDNANIHSASEVSAFIK